MIRPAGMLCLLLLAGCGRGVSLGDTGSTTDTLPKGCDDGAPPDTFVADIARETADGAYTVAISAADPAPPDVGQNTLTVTVDAAAGTPVRLRPWMPLHGHGTSPEWFDGTEQGGAWMFQDVDLFMPGLWELRFTVDSTDEDNGALFRFCLEG